MDPASPQVVHIMNYLIGPIDQQATVGDPETRQLTFTPKPDLAFFYPGRARSFSVHKVN